MVDVISNQSNEGQSPEETILNVSNLKVTFQTPGGFVHAVNGVNFDIQPGKSLGILGESGSGKSVTVGAVMGLLQSPPAIIEGEIDYRGTDMLRAPIQTTRNIHGDRIAMVYQDAITSLNPGLTVGYQIEELFHVHRPGMSRREAKLKTIGLLDRVGIPSASDRVNSYSYEFSGGMNQRIMIALAIALEPDILIADEPTTALDVTVQAQIMQLLSDLQQETGMSLILITHDIGLVAESTDRLMVMYGGRVVENGPTTQVLEKPGHPYTVGLMNSVPQEEMKGRKLFVINGTPPILSKLPVGCAFAPRCPRAEAVCREKVPPLEAIAPGRGSACHFAQEVAND